MPSADHGLLVDTHVWLWSVEGVERRLGRRCRSALERARADSRAFVSAVSVREVVLLAEHGRVRLALAAELWARRAMTVTGFQALPLDPECAGLSARLGGNAPRDPVDQMLIATALLHGLRLVTRDETILAFAAEGGLRVMNAGT
jgi:PIN domain nuclease of toxin-antitoxin system